MILRGREGVRKVTCWWVACLLFVAAAIWGDRISAQTDGGPTLTLHAYANLVQIPTLVLDTKQHVMLNLAPSLFEVSLDSGKHFAPTHVRVEGEDPIDLAIVLDLSGSQTSLLKGFADAVVNLVPGSLHTQDRVWVYGVNCSLIRYVAGGDANESMLRRVLTDAVERSSADTPQRGIPCMRPAPLLAVIATVAHQIEGTPGRRVMLVLTDGKDGGSKIAWSTVGYFVGTRGVAIFGLMDTSDLPLRELSQDSVPADFRQLCQASGGIVMTSSPQRLTPQLQAFVEMLRERYILEFPPPQRLMSGAHSINVRLKRKRNAFIAVSGVTVMRNPKLVSDPTTIPSQAGGDIPVGDKPPDVTR